MPANRRPPLPLAFEPLPKYGGSGVWVQVQPEGTYKIKDTFIITPVLLLPASTHVDHQEAIGPEAAYHDLVQWAIAQCPGLREVPSCARGPSQDGQGSVRGYELCYDV